MKKAPRAQAKLDRQESSRELHERLMVTIRQRGWNQADCVRATGATSPSVNDWFNRGAVPDAVILGRLAKGLKINGHWLLTGQGPKSPPGDARGEELYKAGTQAVVLEVEKFYGRLRELYYGEEVIELDAAALDAVKAVERERMQPRPRHASREAR